jgi:hypothetical protein
MSLPDKAKADVLSNTPKIIKEEAVQWKAAGEDRYRLETRVFAPEMQCVLRLCGLKGRTNYGFTLLYRNYPIRKLTYHHRHRKPNGQSVYGLHKHTWDEEFRDGDCYVPNDIDPNSDINCMLKAFLREENIELLGSYQLLLI